MNINSLAEYGTPKEYHTFFRMEDEKTTKCLPKQPETHYSERLAPAPDVEGGMKKEKKDLRTRIIKYLTLKNSPRIRKLKNTLAHFPALFLSYLMVSSLYPKEALTIAIGFVILLIVIFYRNQPQLNQ